MGAADRVGTAVVLSMLSGLLARDAKAYCQATTCDVKLATSCNPVNGCATEGAPLHWVSRCLSFGVQRDGSPLRHITYAVADSIIRTAFNQWLEADCGAGKHPSFEMWDIGAPFGGIICDQPEFNSTKPNANVFLFRDQKWPYDDESSSLALTSTIFEKSSGVLLDADVEINSHAVELTTTSVAQDVKADLQAIVTHEAGHFLGLGHSKDEQATMFYMYSPGDLNYRSISTDDEAGICATYPPDRAAPACIAPSPSHGFSLYCGGGEDDGTATASGCACATGRNTRPSATMGLLLAAAVAGLRLARHRGARRDTH